MKNRVIEVLTRDHGVKVIQYWKSQGFDTGPMSGILNKADNNICRFYGVIDGKFSCYPLHIVEAAGAEIIELPDMSQPVPTEIQEAITRIEAKLDQLLAEKAKPEVLTAYTFNVGDKVRVKTWKEVKKLTKKDDYLLRLFDNGLIFEYDDRSACGRTGVVMPEEVPPYISMRIDRKHYILAPQAIEKL